MDIRAAQEYILRECDLLPRIIAYVYPLEQHEDRGKSRPPLIGHLMQIAQCIQTLVSSSPSDSAGGSVDSALTEGGLLLKGLLESMPYYEEWRKFAAGPYASLIAIQTTVPIISEAKASDYLSSSNLAALPGANFPQAMFGDRSPENGGFFDDDDDEEEDDEAEAFDADAATQPGRFSADVVDFAQFDAPPAESNSSIFTFASFDDPNVFSPIPTSENQSRGDLGGIVSPAAITNGV